MTLDFACQPLGLECENGKKSDKNRRNACSLMPDMSGLTSATQKRLLTLSLGICCEMNTVWRHLESHGQIVHSNKVQLVFMVWQTLK